MIYALVVNMRSCVTVVVLVLELTMVASIRRKWLSGSLRDLSCHKCSLDNEIFNIQDEVPPEMSIFFVETTCRSYWNKHGIVLTTMQACAVESAALHNPEYTVYVLMMAPIRRRARSDLTNLLLKYENVRIRHVDIKRLAKGSPVEKLVETELPSSMYPIHHTSDFIRFLLLWMFPGVYLDLDVISVKSLSNLPLENWVGAEHSTHLGAGAISLDASPSGRNISHEILTEVATSWISYAWVYNSWGAIVRALRSRCDFAGEPLRVYPAISNGIYILDPKFVYPVSYAWRDWYLSGDMKQDVKEAVFQHTWGKDNSKKQSKVFTSPLIHYARKNCPHVFKLKPFDF